MATIVEVRGDTVILDRALPFEFPAAISTLEKIETVAGVTLSGFTVRGDFGASDPGDFTNTLASEKGGMVILVNATTDTIVNDIEILEPGSSGLVVAKSLDADISDIRVDGAHNKGDGGNGYGIWIRDVYDSSFSGLDITDTRHAVVFASATSAEGNVVSVTHTNRDINFHGGLDHGNVVTVVDSVRNLDEQGYMSPVVFVNGGTDYGAPTGRNVNTVTFSHADGTVRADEIKAAAQGATLFGNGGNDTLRGGAGDDRLDGGTGDDVFRASAGADTITGGSGNDRVYFHNMMAESYVTRIDGKLAIVTGEAVTYVTGVDRLNFKDGSIRLTPEAETSGTSFGALKYSDDAPIVARQQAAVAISDDRFVVADDAVGDVSAELADSGFGGSRPVQQAGAVYHSAPVDFDMTDTIVVDPADHLFT
ncbi:MAG: hypothetical protein HC844_11605 [Tabrizicola sp.]|nr:hypothetical protein [Tabrizicola sp.]